MSHVQGMLVDPVARCFKLVVARENYARDRPAPWQGNFEITTWVFDSALGTWSATTCTLHLPTPETDAFWYNHMYKHQGVFVGSVLYRITKRGNLLAYDVEEAEARWRFEGVRKPRRRLPGHGRRRFRVSYCKGPVHVRGRLLCLAVGEDWQDMSDPIVQVWELDPGRPKRTWMVVASMPRQMIHQLRPWPGPEWNFGSTRVVAVNHEVYVMEVEGADHMVALDLRTTPPAWRRLPDWPGYPGYRPGLQCLDPWLEFGSWIKQQ